MVGPVLVGDDGSDAAAVAVGWARSFAAERGSALAAVYVPGGDAAAPPARVDHVEVREGHAIAAIIDVARDLDADAIVMGRSGRDRLVESPLGGTAYRVAAVSTRPVIVVPVADVFAPGPLVEEIVVGIDGSPESTDAAAWATLTFPDAHFTAVHALELAPAFAQFASEPDAHEVYDRVRTRAVETMRDRWCRPFTDAGVRFDAVVEEGGAVEVLLAAITGAHADLAVVSRRDHALRRGTLGGVGQRVLAYAACPVAVVPSPS